MTNLMVLHWGTVDLTINVSGIDPASGVIETPVKSGVILPTTGAGKAKRLRGSGGVKGISGSGGS